MDELKLLIEMVSNLPTLAVWVLVGYLVYKVAVLGSVYGVLRLVIVKAHDWLTRPKIVNWELGNMCITGPTKDLLIEQLHRLRFTSYIHESGAQILRAALDEYEAKHGKLK